MAQVKPQKPTVRAQNKNTAYLSCEKKKGKIVSEIQATAAYCPIYFNLGSRISRLAGQTVTDVRCAIIRYDIFSLQYI